MNIALWTVQSFLAAIFAGSGLYKGTQPKQRVVASGQTGVVWYSQPFIRFIALAELAGAAGLVLPWLTGRARVLTPLAAGGLAVIMVGAAASHARLARQGGPSRRKELFNVSANIALLGACSLVAIARAHQLR
ncbi:MAG TPA: DoxX family protein [Kofleriaceae bacterium]